MRKTKSSKTVTPNSVGGNMQMLGGAKGAPFIGTKMPSAAVHNSPKIPTVMSAPFAGGKPASAPKPFITNGMPKPNPTFGKTKKK